MMCDCRNEVKSMNVKEKIEELLEAWEDDSPSMISSLRIKILSQG